MIDDKKTFRAQIHTTGLASGRTYAMAMQLLAKAISENALKIELVDCPWGELEKRNEQIEKFNVVIECTVEQFNCHVNEKGWCGSGKHIHQRHESAPMTICLAALKAFGVEVKE